MPDTPDAPGQLPDGIVAQTHAVMENLRRVLTSLAYDAFVEIDLICRRVV
jgi:hypothetical protein